MFNNYITNQNKKIDLYLFKCDFKLVFNNSTTHFKNNFHHNTTIVNLKRYLFYWIQYFIETGHNFSHINEMNNTTINDKLIMLYGHYNKQPMQVVELGLNVIIAKNPHLIISLNRYTNHLLIRRYSQISFNN